jgi:preprotein translocase subunit YajC
LFITPAYAQAGAPGAGDFIGMILPLVLIMGVFYFLLIRPQQRKMKEHQEVGENVKVRILRSGIADVRAKGEPVKAETK